MTHRTPSSKPLAAEVFARELATAGQTARLAAATGSDLLARGYHAQVQVQDDSLALFRLDGSRLAIRRQDSRLVAGEETYAADALQEEARARPAAFSPGVLLRPIVQDTLFPTVCYVAGPNELAYLGQLRGVYAPLRRPDAADVSAGDRDPPRLRLASFPDEISPATRSTPGTG